MELYWHTVDYLRQGGWIMGPLLAVSVVMWTLIVDRWRELRQLEGERLAGLLESEFAAAASGHRELDVEILQECRLRLRRGLDRQLAVIAVLAGIAPLLGLLGTVLGMIETFDVIARFGTGNARALAGGISVALITTQTGLLVAIPGLIMSNRLGSKAAQLATALDQATARLARVIAGEQDAAAVPEGGK